MGSCLGHCCILRCDYRCRTFFSYLRAKHKENTSLHIELLDDAWSLDDVEHLSTSGNGSLANRASESKKYVENQRCATPTSLDLEWENLPEMELSTSFTDVEEREQQITTNSLSTCSHVTSRDSLEWDPIIGGMNDVADLETEQLLNEIEMLHSKVLQETQKWSS